MQKPLLELDHVTVSFDGFHALDDLSFRVATGGVKVLIGPNGSGKSTLLDTVIGKVRPASGRVLYNGRDITSVAAHKIAHMGIRRKFQAPGVLPNLSVYDNLVVAVRESKGVFASMRWGLRQRERDRVEEVLDMIALSERREVLGSHLSHGEKQWLEIGMVISSDPELLLLDEPTAGMTHQESAMTAELIQRLGELHTVLVIDHDMAFVELLDASISVLHMGKLLKEGSMEAIRSDPSVVSVYLGQSLVAAHA